MGERVKGQGRNHGVDALRVCSMLMVVVLHILNRGGVISSVESLTDGGLSWRYAAMWLFEAAAFCAVNCYGLISGYVGVRAKYRYANFIVLWLRVAFYSVGITFLFAVFMPGTVGKGQWVDAFLPVIRADYWYFTAYAGLFLLMPVLNAGLSHLTKRQMSVLVAGGVIAFSVIPALFKKDVFRFSSGYSAWWLIYLYMLGGYIGKYGMLKRAKAWHCFAGYIVVVVYAWGMKLASRAALNIPGAGVNWIDYLSPTIVAASVFLLLGFERSDLAKLAKVIRFFSPLAFSVYLIHTHRLIWEYWMGDRFASYGHLSAVKEVILVPATAVGIFVACSLVDALRERLFLKLRVRQRLLALEDRAFGDGSP